MRHQAHGGIADADHPSAEFLGHRLGDQPGRVGEVDDPRPGGAAGDPAGELTGHRHGPQAVRDPARAHRLLAEDSFRQGDPLVRGAPFQATDADGGKDEIGPAQGFFEVPGGGDGRGAARCRVVGSGGLVPEDPGHGSEPRRVLVVQRHMGHPALGTVAEQGSVDERYPESASAEDRQPHALPPFASADPVAGATAVVAGARSVPRTPPRSVTRSATIGGTRATAHVRLRPVCPGRSLHRRRHGAQPGALLVREAPAALHGTPRRTHAASRGPA